MEQKLFHHFFEVICVDTVNQTNKDKRPLLAMKRRDTHGKMFNIACIFTKQKSASIFWGVLPTLFLSYKLSQVKAIITDGCSQEFIQIDNVRKIIFKNALWIQCGMGWTQHVTKKKYFPDEFGSLYDEVCDHLKRWIYSWMKSLCETQEEFMASMLMFKKFLNSKQIKSTLGTPYVDSVQNFITKHIEPHEPSFCFYVKLNLRHLEEYNNSRHERTNYELKYNTAQVDLSTKIKKAMVIMCNNAKRNG